MIEKNMKKQMLVSARKKNKTGGRESKQAESEVLKLKIFVWAYPLHLCYIVRSTCVWKGLNIYKWNYSVLHNIFNLKFIVFH